MKPPSITAVSSAAASPKPSTLEKVARALAEAMLGRPVEAAFITEPCTGGATYVEAARAALNALRQVDDETVAAMAGALGYQLHCDHELDLEDAELESLARSAADSLFDSILTEGGEG